MADVIEAFLNIITTSRAGGMHRPPWGMPLAEPIGSSNYFSLACPALPPQMRLYAHRRLPCVKGKRSAVAVVNDNPVDCQSRDRARRSELSRGQRD